MDIRYALRLLLRTPGFTIVALLTLALGIGANTAMFSVVRAVILKPLPYRDPARLAAIWDTYLPTFPKLGVSPLELEALERQTDLFEQTAWYRYISRDFNLIQPDMPATEVHATFASPELFPLLGVAPAAGRAFSQEAQSVLLSDHLWRSRFNANPEVVGQSIHLGDDTYTVAGVMPPDFHFPETTDVWLPAGPQLGDERTNPLRHALGLIVRLKPGVTPKQVSTRVDDVYRRLALEHPKTSKAFGTLVSGLQDDLTATRRPSLLLLWGAVSAVLLIACGNVANLLLAKAASRNKEFAIRSALGAGTGRIVRQLLTESVVLSVLGGAIGLLFAKWGLAAFSPVPAPIDTFVLLFFLAVSLLVGVVFGLAPVLELRKSDRVTVLKPGSAKVRNAVIIGEFAFTLIVVAGAGILAKSFLYLMQVDPGFNASGVLTLRVATQASQKPDVLFDRIEDRLKRLPGVQSIAIANTLPLIANRSAASRFTVPGSLLINPDALPVAQIRFVSPDYFSTLKIPVRAGRPFSRQDVNQPVVIVNETMARRFWPGQDGLAHGNDAVGRKFVTGPWGPNPNWATIVGVAGDVKQFGLDSEPTMDIYFPSLAAVYVVLQTAADPLSIGNAAQQEIQAINPELAVLGVRSMSQIVAESADARRWTMSLLSSFAVLAFVLALIGIYGVTAWGVAQRTREMGIRLALGAGRGQVMRMVLGRGLVLCSAGVCLGLAGAFALRRFLFSLTFGVSTADPYVLGGAVLLMIGAALLACYLPARRASRVDPMTALRYE